MTVDELLETVVLADELGYESAHLIESYADVFGFLGACAAQTRRITLATGVTTVFTRSPATIAIGAITVDNLSGGRFELGLGVGHPEIHARRDDLEEIANARTWNLQQVGSNKSMGRWRVFHGRRSLASTRLDPCRS